MFFIYGCFTHLDVQCHGFIKNCFVFTNIELQWVACLQNTTWEYHVRCHGYDHPIFKMYVNDDSDHNHDTSRGIPELRLNVLGWFGMLSYSMAY